MILSGAEGVGRLVLDTSAYSRFRAGDERVLEIIAACEIIYLPTIVLGELEAAFSLGRRERENRSVLGEFLAESFVSILPVTPAVARRYGRLFADLRRAGTPIPINDIWIAATALDCGGHLLTFDGDFGRIPSLDCTILAP
ncbi:MAG TPA: type II toxin-antitoxin system VapC family toxin [Thermoanaerobaculia bacterium]|jgi:tRNA(fMet)-specific endonuclease VapC|nr:type II toxin-antitoxin system VapC family toxin [Thermoanaerobaculia bacterium]